MMPPDELRTWTREVGDLTYTCSTDPSLIQLDSINAVFDSDLIYWAKPLPIELLRRTVEQSLCFGLYLQQKGVEDRQDDGATPPLGPMIGFARLVTDYVTFGYLTDVYVLTEHQGKGLARWMMECLDEVLVAWPYLRRCVLFTGTKGAARLYRETIGALDLSETSTGKLIVMEKPGRTVTVLDGIEKKEGAGGVKEGE